MPKHAPADAMTLLRSRRLIERACDVVRNGAFAKASATTRDAREQRILDHVNTAEARRSWPVRIGALFALPLEQFEQAMALEPVRLSQVPKPDGGTRAIVVPTFLRRCVSNALNDVLELTSDRLLPACVRAYRPGRENAVQETILDTAEAVHDGRLRYFAKLDFKAYFSEMQWRSIEEALRRFGYDQEFIARVMIVVKCSVVQKTHGRLAPIAIDRGAQMGLAESSALANLLPWALDEELEVHSPRLHYVRYSDDLLVGAAQRHEVVAAVRSVGAWCRRHGLQLKGVERNARLANLVHDVKKTKIDLLGAEIDQHGNVHIPAAKLTQKLAALDHMHTHLSLGDVSGTSRYGDGNGIEAYDDHDLHNSARAYLDYWSALDPRGAENAAQIIRRRFPVTSATSCAERGAVWVARLWGTQTDHEAGYGLHDPTKAGPRPTRLSPPATRATAEDNDLPEPGAVDPAGETEDTTDDLPRGLSLSADDGEEELADPRSTDGRIKPSSLAHYPNAHLFGDDDLYSDPNRRMSEYRLDTSSATTEIARKISLEYEIPSRPGVLYGSRAVGDPAGGASPPRPVFEKSVITFVHTIGIGVGPAQRVLVGRCDVVDGNVHGVRIHVVRSCRSEAALVRQMISELAIASSASIQLGMVETWLAKSLLQPHRRFRAPLLFGRVLELHEAGRGRHVKVVGGLPLPQALRSGLDDLRDELQRRIARDRAAPALAPAHAPPESM